MRTLFAALLTVALSATAGAQGRLIPRPCPEPVPPPCREGRCPPIRTCIANNAIVRTSSQVRVEMVNRVLRYEVDETFVNNGGGLGEADYLFPLPAGSAFEDLKLSINGELVSGETMNATDARRIYEDIVRRQKDPALVEWMGAGLLRARIFPINPGEEKRVVVRFQSIAQREGDALRIDYVRGTEPAQNQAVSIRPVQNGDENWETANTFSLTYDNSRDYGTAYSPTHRLFTRERSGRQVVRASGDGREVTILLPLRRASEAGVSVLTHRVDSDQGFALITITPPTADQVRQSRDVTFVIDVSGSMRGEKLEQAKAAGHALLSSLTPIDRFRVIAFSTDVDAHADNFLDATPQNIRDAKRFLDRLRAEGSTNISGALEEALSVRTSSRRLPLVVFLTDGEPTVGERDPDAIAAIAARERGDARVFTVGVSADVNSALIERLAIEGRGTAHFVRAGENVERPVSLLASRLTNPVLTNVRVTVDGVRLSRVQPSGTVDIFAGQDLVLLARYEGDGSANVRIEGQSATGRTSWSSRATFERRTTRNAFVPRLWAAQRIGWLAAEKRRTGSREMDSEIKSLGERYGIPTEFSSYLVLEPGMDVAQQSRRVDVGGAVRGVVGAGAGNRANDAAVTAPTAAAPPPQTANEARFELSRQAAAQREAKSLASLDAMADAAGVQARQVGTRQFIQQGNVWTDQRYVPTQRKLQVKAFSPLYFELVNQLNGFKEAMSLGASGSEVLIAGRNVAIQVGTSGLEKMNTQQVQDLVKDWQ